MTLRDELEKKLRDIYFKAEADVFGEIADECIRQMVYQLNEVACNDALSVRLAPEDWKP